jgi:long-chain acyl-CoA synthetase
MCVVGIAQIPGYEIIKAIHLEPEPFTVDNDLLTPTLKLKRPQLLKRYGDVIDQMYAHSTMQRCAS